MKTIWKFPIPQQTPFCLEMPRFSRVLAVQMQEETPCIWVEVEPDGLISRRAFHIVGTGRELPPEAHQYLGTWQNGVYVWHLYEEHL